MQQENALQVQPSEGLFFAVDMSATELPDLEDADVMPIELTSVYWTPEAAGECKKVFFDAIKTRLMPAQKEGDEPVVLPCAYFIEKVNNDYVSICNGSKRLVAAIENGLVQRGVPLIITYTGKKKNATNSFTSDTWSVKPLVPKGFLIDNGVKSEISSHANKESIGFAVDMDNMKQGAPEAKLTVLTDNGKKSSTGEKQAGAPF